MKTRLAATSLGLAIAAAVFLLVWPVYSVSVTRGVGIGQRPITSARRATLLQVNGSWAIIPVMFPVAIAALPVVFRKQPVRVIAMLLMSAFSIVAGMSVGTFYAPAAILMILSVCVADSARWRDAVP
jgi:hypothetical protein